MLLGKVASRAVALAVAVCLVAIPANAGMQNYVDGQVGEMKNIAKSFQPSVVQAQGKNMVTFGGFRDRFDLNGEIRPLQVTLPSLSFGCGGIDLNWGGMSALQFKYIIDAFKHILQVAPAMAFQMAFSQLCRDCAGIMASLQKAANMINGLSMDKCKAAQQAGALMSNLGASLTGMVAPNLVSASGGFASVFEITNDGKQDTSSLMSNFETWMNTANDYINCDPGLIATGGYTSCADAGKTKMSIKPGSLMHDAFKEAEWGLFAGDRLDFENMMRGLLGDVLTTKKVSAAKAKDGSTMTVSYWPSDSGMTPFDFHDVLYGTTDNATAGKTYKSLPVSYDGDGNPTVQKEISLPFDGIYMNVYNAFTNLVNAIRSDSPISSSSPDLAFVHIGSNFPVYRILNLFAASPASDVDDNIKVLADVVANKLIALMSARISGRITKVLSAYTAGQLDYIGDKSKFMEHVDKMKLRLSTMKTEADRRNEYAMESLMTAIGNAAAYQNLEAKLLKTVMTHVLAGQYITSRSWGR